MQLRIFTEPQEGAGCEQQLAVAQTAEALGFDERAPKRRWRAVSGERRRCGERRRARARSL